MAGVYRAISRFNWVQVLRCASQGIKMTDTTKPAIAIRLRLLADMMETLGADIDYYGGMAPWAECGRVLVADAATWISLAEVIEKESA